MIPSRYIGLLVCMVLPGTAVLAQQSKKQDGAHHLEQIRLVRPQPEARKAFTPPFDTLRNYDPALNLLTWVIDSNDLSRGFVHGTNEFEDQAKATRLSLPPGIPEATLTDVTVFFGLVDPVGGQTYDIEIYDVGSGGAPGTRLGSQTFNAADAVGDDDVETVAEPTVHRFDEPVTVPEAFFVAVNFGTYSVFEYGTLGIAASDRQGRRVEEEWELDANGAWALISDNWFDNDDDGWYMWVEAVVDLGDGGPEGDAGNRAEAARNMAYGTEIEEEINPVGDVDYYRFDAQAGDIVDIFAFATEGSTLDGRLRLYDAAGTLIAENDDELDETRSLIQTILPDDGPYFIRYAEYTNVDAFPGKRDPGLASVKPTLTAPASGVRSSRRDATTAGGHGIGAERRPGSELTADPSGTPAETGGYFLVLNRMNLSPTAGSGFDELVPVQWNEVFVHDDLLEDPSVAYNLYRSTSPSGPFTLQQTVLGAWAVDTEVSNGTTYSYQVSATILETGIESARSPAVSATPNGNRAYDLTLDEAATIPTIDGQINADEWNDARQVDITSPFIDGIQPVTLWLKNDARFLYIAADNPNATGSTNEMGIYFDDDNNDTWDPTQPSGEGNYWIDDFSGALQVLFRPIAGDFPDVLFGEVEAGPAGVVGAISAASGHVQFEVAVDLTESNVTVTPGHTLGLYVFVRDDARIDGLYPPGNGVFTVPAAFADVTLGRSNVAPAITPVAVATPAPAATDLTVSASVSDDSGLARVALFYRPGGADTFTEVPMTAQNEGYQGTIPASAVTARGLQYYLEAQDPEGLVTTTDLTSVRVRIDGDGLSTSVATPGETEAAYRLVSVPMDLDDKAPRSVFEDDLGSYDPVDWRFYGLSADQTYAEFPNAGSMQPGRAFWLAVRESGTAWDTGPGTSVALDAAYEVALNRGWTFVATPFDFDWPQAALHLESGAALDLRSFTGSWQAHTGALRPFAGYAAFAAEADVLRFEPAPAAKHEDPTEPVLEWEVHVVGESGGVFDTENSLGVSASASVGWDGLDRAEPPVVGRYVSVAFPHPEWGLPVPSFQRDVRPGIEGVESWDVEVATNVGSPVELRFEGVETVPPAFAVWLVDEGMGVVQNVREQARYVVSGSGESKARRLTVLVGPEEAMAARLDEAEPRPVAEVLEGYPNPFSVSGAGAATIRYGLAEAGAVTVRLYDVLGKRVATLVEEVQEPGYHVMTWDGRDEAGGLLASGVYVCELRVGERRLVRKLILTK